MTPAAVTDHALAVHRFLSTLSGWRAGLAAVALGALSALAMAPFYIFPILILTLTGAVWLIDGAMRQTRPLRAAAFRGWAFGFGYCAAGFYWIGYSFLVTPDAHLWLLPFAAAAFPGGLALFFAAGFCAAASVWRGDWRRVLVFAFAISATEWLRGHILTGLPWNLFGYTWGVSVETMQLASIVGVYGLTLATLVAFAAPAALIQAQGILQPRAHLAWAAVALPVALFLFGWIRLPAAPQPAIDGLRLRVVQPNVPQTEKWKPDLALRNWQRLIEPLALNGQAPYTHAVWPEAAPPFILSEHAEAMRMIGLSLPRGATLLTGAVFREAANGDMKFYNGFHAVNDQGQVIATYAKAHLVPFGEYLPFAGLLENLGITKITGGKGGYSSGPGVRSLTIPAGFSADGQKTTLGPLICYEIVFSGEVVEPGKRPDWLVNLTDDSWFGPSTGPYQHLGISRMRAVEEGLAVVRAANTGISAIIDPYGRLVATLPLASQGALDGDVPKPLHPTGYATWGNVIYNSAMAAIAVWIVWGRRRWPSVAGDPDR
jgi:apolipoprotein N-acyltransferase